MIFCGIPIFLLEVAIGQYLGSGGMTAISQLVPILKGELFEATTHMDYVSTDFLAYCDTIGIGQKFHYKWCVTVTSHFYCKDDPIEAKQSVTVVGLYHCNRCYCKRGRL